MFSLFTVIIFHPKDLPDQIPPSVILKGDFIGHHTLWGCEEVNNVGKQLENVILKNDLILFNDLSSIHVHSACGT